MGSNPGGREGELPSSCYQACLLEGFVPLAGSSDWRSFQGRLCLTGSQDTAHLGAAKTRVPVSRKLRKKAGNSDRQGYFSGRQTAMKAKTNFSVGEKL